MSETVRTSPSRRTATGPWGVVVLATVAFASLLAKLQVNDLAYQLRVGEWMRAARAIARTDMLTFTVFGQPWLNQQWGSQLILSAAYDIGGWKGMIFLRALLVVACFGATFRLARSAGSSQLVAGVCTLAGYVAAALVPGTLALRPQMLALPLFLMSVWVIRSRSSHPRRMYLLPFIGILWTNTHGSFPLITLLLVISLLHDAMTGASIWRRTAAMLAVSLVTPLISPWGFGTYRYVWLVATSPMVRRQITEWQPLYADALAGATFLFLVVIGCVVYAKRRSRAATIEEAIGLAIFTGLAVWSSRNILWWSVFVPPVIGGLLAGWRPGAVWSRGPAFVVSATLLSGVVLGSALVASRPASALLTEAPAGITQALATTSPGENRIFNEWWGSWFEFALPDRPMFTDARVELFPDPVWDDYYTVVGAEAGWEDVLDEWDISVIVVNRQHTVPLTDALAADTDWTRSYEDGDGFIYERVSPQLGA